MGDTSVAIEGTYLALDVGATKIEAGRVCAGCVEDARRIPIRPFCGRDALLDDLTRALSAVRTEDMEGLAIGFPGLLDYENGSLLGQSVFPAMEGFPLRSHFSEFLNVPVVLDTDANLATLGVQTEVEYGRFAVLTLGSGTGVGLVLDDQLIRGEHGIPDAVFSCLDHRGGRRYTSGYLFPEVYGVDGKELARLAAAGEPNAMSSFARLGKAVAAIVEALGGRFDLEAVGLTGGVTRSLQYFEQPMLNALRSVELHVFLTRMEYPALVGGALLAARSAQEPPRAGL